MFICFDIRQNLGKKSIAFVFCWIGGYWFMIQMWICYIIGDSTILHDMIWYVASMFLRNLLSSKQWSYHPFWIINVVDDSVKLWLLRCKHEVSVICLLDHFQEMMAKFGAYEVGIRRKVLKYLLWFRACITKLFLLFKNPDILPIVEKQLPFTYC